MKKMFFMAAVAALALSSCSSDELVQDQPVAEDGAVTFSAGVLRDARTNSMQDINLTWLKTGTGTTGFGVFAYEHGTTPWTTYNTYNTVPNFMFNQDVKWNSTGSKWEYSPVKYFSNNEGAMHSFFAYAPYDKDVKAVFSLANGAPAIRYNAADNYDLLWAKNIEVKKPGVDATVDFAFAHALSKVDFKVTYFVDEIHKGTHPSDSSADDFKDNYTTVTVRSVKFIGAVPSQGVLNLGDGTWAYEATEESAYEFAPSTPVKFTWDGSSDDAMEYKPLKTGNLVLPTIAANKVKIQVVYDVTTVDNENPRNNSTITNTITSTGDGFALVAGHHYTFKLDLGLTSVKFNVTEVENWDTESDKTIDLPDNLYAGLAAQPMLSLSKVEPSAPISADAKWYDASNHIAKKRNSGNTDWEKDESVNGVIETATNKVDVVASGEGTPKDLTTIYYKEGKYYSDEACTSEMASLTSGAYYKINGMIYKAN